MTTPYFERAASCLDAYRGENGADAALLEALEHALGFCVQTGDIEGAFVRLLPAVLQVSESAFGFLAEVCYAGDRPYLQSHAVSNIYRPGFGGGEIVSGLAFHNLDTLNGAIMTGRRPVVSNDPKNDPRSGGMPSDHARLQAFLGLPFLVDGDLVGAVALANRADGYSEREVVLLSPLCEIGGLMIAGYRNPQPG